MSATWHRVDLQQCTLPAHVPSRISLRFDSAVFVYTCSCCVADVNHCLKSVPIKVWSSVCHPTMSMSMPIVMGCDELETGIVVDQDLTMTQLVHQEPREQDDSLI